ncbi:MAG: hypothetical protein ACRDXE_09305 [Acidimicrobiales bacterium]
MATSFNGPAVIFARGVFNAGGTDLQRSKKDLAVFPGGAFTIHHPGGTASQTFNPRTCVSKVTGTGSYTIDQGYGTYQGIHGSGTYVFHSTFTAAHNADGTCNSHAQPTATYTTIEASGPLSF